MICFGFVEEVVYITTPNRKLKTQDTARQTVEKNMNLALQLTEDIDTSTTAQNDFAEIFALRDTLVEKFDKTPVKSCENLPTSQQH